MMQTRKINREVEIGRVKTVLRRMSSTALEDFQAYAFGSSHTVNNIVEIPTILNGAADLIYTGPVVKGFRRLVPIPKPKYFSYVINDNSCIFDLFNLLDFFLLITIVFAEATERDKIFNHVSTSDANPFKLETILSGPFILHTFDLDAAVESGMTENVIVSEGVTENIRLILGINEAVI